MSGFQRWLVWSTSLLTGLSGLVYWWMRNVLEPMDDFAAINHPLEPWVLKAHILAAPLMVFALGLVAGEHIWRQYRLRVRAGRRSGLVAAAVIAPMVLSGYLIQTVASPGWLSAAAWAHLATGLVYLTSLVAHHRVVRRLWTAAPSIPSASLDQARAGRYGRTDSRVGTTASTRNDGSR